VGILLTVINDRGRSGRLRKPSIILTTKSNYDCFRMSPVFSRRFGSVSGSIFKGYLFDLGVRAHTDRSACCPLLYFILLCRPYVLFTFKRNGARRVLSCWRVIHALHFVSPFLHWRLLFICVPKVTGRLAFSFSSRLSIPLSGSGKRPCRVLFMVVNYWPPGIADFPRPSSLLKWHLSISVASSIILFPRYCSLCSISLPYLNVYCDRFVQRVVPLPISLFACSRHLFLVLLFVFLLLLLFVLRTIFPAWSWYFIYSWSLQSWYFVFGTPK